MRFEVSTLDTAALDRNSRAGILELAKVCSNRSLSRGPWPRVSSLLESPSEALATSFTVLATDEEDCIRGVALVVMAGKSLPSCQLFVAPQSRRKGIGRRLLHQALLESKSDGLRVWNHGDSVDGRHFAKAEKLRQLQSLAFFVKNTDEYAHIVADTEPQGGLQYEIGSTDNLNVGWRDVVTQAYQTNRVVAELESRQWWSKSWGIVVPEPDGEKLAGVLVARTVSYLQRPSIENHVMAVAPKWQGAGISKILLSGLTALATDLNIPSVISYVVASNRNAMEAHKNSGFSKLSEDSVYVFCV